MDMVKVKMKHIKVTLIVNKIWVFVFQKPKI